jgi:predicted aconitase
VELTAADLGVLKGERGDGAALAMRLIMEYGRAIGAVRLISVTRAHVDGCLYQGDSGLDFAQALAGGGARVSVPTTLNVGLVDLLHPQLNLGNPERVAQGRRLMRLYEDMGCSPTWTCAPYQLPDRPGFGEQVAWAESNAIAFINSVVGARTDRYGDFIDICAGIVGRVPDHGLHRTDNRRGRVLFDVSGLPGDWFANELMWPLLGFVVGAASGGRVPVVDGVPATVSEDSLKAFGAAAATSGSVALFHVVGITPEAPDRAAALQGQVPEEVIDVTGPTLRNAHRELTKRGQGELAAVSVGTPHFSITEFEALVGLVSGRRCRPEVGFYVTTGRAVLAEVERRGWLEPLQDFGATIVVDSCTYLTPFIRPRRGEVVMTNSAKWAYYAPGNLGHSVVLATLSDCVRSAHHGRIQVSEPLAASRASPR